MAAKDNVDDRAQPRDPCATLRQRVAELEAERRTWRAHLEQDAMTSAHGLDRHVIESAHEGIIVYGPDLRYRLWNPYMEQLSGRTTDEVLGKRPSEVFPFLDDVGVTGRLAQALAGELPAPVEFAIEIAGETRWCVDTSAPLRDDAGDVVGVIATVQDVTEVRLQDALTRSRLHLYEFATAHSLEELLTETANEAERLTRSQLAFYSFVGTDQRTLSLRTHSTRTEQELRAAAGAGRQHDLDRAELWATCIHTRQPRIHEGDLGTSDDDGRPNPLPSMRRALAVPVVRDNLVVALLGVANKTTSYRERDVETLRSLANAAWEVAQRKHAEARLHESERRFSEIAHASSGIVWEVDAHFVITHVSGRLREILGYQPQEVIGRPMTALINATDRSRVATILADLARHAAPVVNHEHWFRSKDGQRVRVVTSAVPVLGPSGEFLGMRGTHVDITESYWAQHDAEALLQLHEVSSEDHSRISVHLTQVLAEQTESPMAFFGMLEPDGAAMVAHGWSPAASSQCAIPDRPLRFPVAHGGLWAEPIRRRCPVIVNDYHAAANKTGTPEGHVPLTRFLGVPIVRGDTVIAVAGLANKPSAYDDHDARRVQVLASVISDFLASRAAEQQARHSHHRLHTFIDFTADWEYWLRPDGTHEYVSSACERITGYRPSEFMADPELIARIVHPDDVPTVAAHTCTAREPSAQPREMEFRVVRKDGDTRWIQHACRPVLEPDGTYAGARVSNRDVTERKRAEDLLRTTRARTAEMLNSIVDTFFSLDLHGNLLVANRTAERAFFGEAAEKLLGKCIWELQPELVGTALHRHCQDVAAERRLAHLEVQSPINQRWYECFVRGRGDGVDVYLRDISERKQQEAALLESETRYRMVFEHSGTANAIFDEDCRLVLQNSESAARLGRSADDARGKSVRELLGPETGAVIEVRMREALRTGRSACYETKFELPGGTQWFRSAYEPVRDDCGTVVAVQVISQDITTQRRAEEALRLSEERYRALVELSPDLVAIHQDGRLVFINANGAAMLGAETVDALLGRPVTDFLLGRRREAAKDRIDRLHPRGTQSPLYQQSLRRLDGSELDAELTDLSFELDGRPAVQVVARDIRERKRAEEESARFQKLLHHAQKMEAIGTLAGGVAHDFNNILGGVLSGLALLELELGEETSRHRNDIEDMKDLVRRGAELAKQLLGFSRRGKYDAAPRDVHEVVQKAVAVFARARRDITIVQDMAAELDAAVVDHVQLEQVLLNLFINAGHAMPSGGRLWVRAENAGLAAAETEPHGVEPGQYVKIVVADEGDGIAPSVLPRIFEPFFTTKQPGQGTGLGLASVYGIVKNHGGLINVESELGKGTTFALYLPAAGKRDIVRPPRKASPSPNGGQVLVVDDDVQLLRVSARLLRAMGYDVLTAGGGREAVDLVRRHAKTLRLVILDLTMPEMSGAATFDAIRELAPTMKVLLASGFSPDGQAQALLDRGCDGFIHKPFEVAELLETIQAILRGLPTPGADEPA